MTARVCVTALLAALLVASCGDDKSSPTSPSPTTTTVPPVVTAPWTLSGSGNTVFDMPTTVTRVRIRGVWNGVGTSNFIVRVAGTLVVNEVLREMPNRTYEGVHAVRGGQTEITNSSAIAWTFTEDR